MDLVSGVLVALGYAEYVPAVAAGVAIVGFVVAHSLPWLPPPGLTGVWAGLYPLLVKFAGNYGNMTPAQVQGDLATLKEIKK